MNAVLVMFRRHKSHWNKLETVVESHHKVLVNQGSSEGARSAHHRRAISPAQDQLHPQLSSAVGSQQAEELLRYCFPLSAPTQFLLYFLQAKARVKNPTDDPERADMDNSTGHIKPISTTPLSLTQNTGFSSHQFLPQTTVLLITELFLHGPTQTVF